MNSLGDRIRSVRRQKNISQAELAKLANVSQGAISQLESGRNETSKELPQIALALGVDVYWLQTGKTDLSTIDKTLNPYQSEASLSNKKIAVWNDGDNLPEGMIPIRYLTNIVGSLGNGYPNEDYYEEITLWFREETIIECNVNPDYARIINVQGDSMFPEIVDGQVIAIDTSATRIFDGEIYAFVVNGELKVKYLFKLKDGFKAVSRNDDKLRYPDEIYTANDIENENIRILGQFWWKSEIRRVRR
ncbi:S24 family peptidase [Moraxella sp. ZY210820]|uniref:XRE family transcriptional regulator n=1 Tax=Moraxella sp. ZY210820 TaxID=2904123 RepID=UPI002731BC71|nr:S24 family peptidase [Moraxella sp. ZY210820]WLF84809.1 helix-turn-helix domain-containing protein [Moraxella sp. ZY210820]